MKTVACKYETMINIDH